ncbi:MAG: ubiquinone/menaquinone biosynthesis methyltransferase [Euryarchaeota archaeon]|nr:ubiquinone/menaquinone biosynthesis methyltransferase [Euryarchaeota archaeon]
MMEDIKPNGTQFDGKEGYVKDVFTEIAGYYDEMNEIMTMGMVSGWHRFMLDRIEPLAGRRCADIGTGTGEIAFMTAERVGEDGSVVGIDITPRMLELAESKLQGTDLAGRVVFEEGDALDLRYEDGSFDAVTSGYMLRNVCDVQKAIDEMYRILAPGGKVVVAELAKPDNRMIRFFYELYIKYRVTRIARRYDKGESIGGRQPAYDWLTSSVEGFPHGDDMVEKFRKAGFRNARYYRRNFSAVNIYYGEK